MDFWHQNQEVSGNKDLAILSTNRKFRHQIFIWWETIIPSRGLRSSAEWSGKWHVVVEGKRMFGATAEEWTHSGFVLCCVNSNTFNPFYFSVHLLLGMPTSVKKVWSADSWRTCDIMASAQENTAAAVRNLLTLAAQKDLTLKALVLWMCLWRLTCKKVRLFLVKFSSIEKDTPHTVACFIFWRLVFVGKKDGTSRRKRTFTRMPCNQTKLQKQRNFCNTVIFASKHERIQGNSCVILPLTYSTLHAIKRSFLF